jgi:hypothetical protein
MYWRIICTATLKDAEEDAHAPDSLEQRQALESERLVGAADRKSPDCFTQYLRDEVR